MCRIVRTQLRVYELVARSLTQRCYPASVGRTFYHNDATIKPMMATNGSIDVDLFRSLAWEPAIPMHLQEFHHLPAMDTWFTNGILGTETTSPGPKLSSFHDTVVSYELIASPHGDESSEYSLDCLRDFQTWLNSRPAEEDSLLSSLVGHLLQSIQDQQLRFLQFDAPLGLLIQASQYNRSTKSLYRIKQLYIAQSDIRTLPAPLSEDLPIPGIVSRAGKGDIYSSSIWLGLQPTYTPLHRDPNPNLFCQLVGSKAVRLLRPRDGMSVFQDVRRKLGAAGNSRFRGPEMMEGPERDGLHHAVWVDPNSARETWQAVLSPGDALFIPRGWWHSVRSVGQEAELNASANWWFR